jgi:hypothetical protein
MTCWVVRPVTHLRSSGDDWQGEAKLLGEKPAPVLFCPP